ncbi:hypothetical protein IFO70_39180 [Phormidium tenue FACHB-886]|nr:hypothetical protein [Phormidium tenue FACHB-886]
MHIASLIHIHQVTVSLAGNDRPSPSTPSHPSCRDSQDSCHLTDFSFSVVLASAGFVDS